MSQFAKDVQAEIRKRAAERIVAWIGLLLSGLSPTVKLWASRLSLSDSQVSSIKYWLLFAGSIALISVAWVLFLRTFRKLQLVEKQLRDSLATPRKVSDDYEHLKDRGFWVHRKTGERVCGNCLITDIVSPLACFGFKNARGGFDRNAWVCGRKDCGKECFFDRRDTKPHAI